MRQAALETKNLMCVKYVTTILRPPLGFLMDYWRGASKRRSRRARGRQRAGLMARDGVDREKKPRARPDNVASFSAMQANRRAAWHRGSVLWQ